MYVRDAFLRPMAPAVLVVLTSLSLVTRAEAGYTLSFRALGPGYAGDENWDFNTPCKGQLQVFVDGNAEPLYQEAFPFSHWSKPVTLALPDGYSNQPIIFRLVITEDMKTEDSQRAMRIMISDAKIIDSDGKLLNLGKWNYDESASNFQGFIGENNILIERPIFSGKNEAGDWCQFKSEAPTKAPDIKLGYDDVTLLTTAGEEIANYEVKPGQTAKLRANVHNIGTLDAANVTVGLYDIHWNTLELQNLSLSSGHSNTVEFAWTAPAPQKSVFLRIATDRDSQVAEANEYNNHACKIITGPHPFLWFYEHEIPAIKDKVRNQRIPNECWMTGRNSVKSLADRALDRDFKSLMELVEKDWRAPKRENVFSGNEMEAAAFAYVLTGDEKYAQKVKESLLYRSVSAPLNRSISAKFSWAFDWTFNYLNDHDDQDINGNGKSDLAEIQDILAQRALRTYCGLGGDFPPDFGGADHQTHGESIAPVIPIICSLLGYKKTMEFADPAGPARSIEVYSVFHGADEWLVEAFSHFLGYPDPSRYGGTSYYNDEGIPSWFGVMYGDEGMFEEGSYYATPPNIFLNMLIAEHLGIDVTSQEHIHNMADWWIKAAAPDSTLPLYAHSLRRGIATEIQLAPSLYRKSNGNVYMWYIKRAGGPGTGVLSILTFDQKLYDSAAAPDTYWDSPTHFLPNAGAAILRSDWSRDGMYMFLLGQHRTSSGLATAHSEGDATHFNLFAKGEYLAVNTGDGRFSDGRVTLEEGDYGDVDDAGAWLYPWRRDRRHNFVLHGPVGCNMIRIDDLDSSGGRPNVHSGEQWRNVPGETPEYRHVLDKAYIENAVDTEFMDYVEVRGHLGDAHELVPAISTIDVDNIRRVLFPGHEYFIIVDELKSLNDKPHKYSFQLHLSGKQEATNTVVNKRLPFYKLAGSLLVEGMPVPWDKKVTSHSNCDASCSWPCYKFPRKKELLWKTRNMDNQEIALKMFFAAPEVDISVERGDGNYLSPANFSPYINPYVRASTNATDVKFVTFLYPWEMKTEPEPSIVDVPAKGGYAGRVSVEGRNDLVLVKEDGSPEVTAGPIKTDARVAFASLNSGLKYCFIRAGSSFAYDGNRELSISRNVAYLIQKRNGAARTLKMKGQEGGEIDINLHNMPSQTTYRVRRDGELYSNWKMAADKLIITTDSGEHSFQVTPAG